MPPKDLKAPARLVASPSTRFLGGKSLLILLDQFCFLYHNGQILSSHSAWMLSLRTMNFVAHQDADAAAIRKAGWLGV